LYHFANYNFTLVATVSVDGVPKEGTTIPLMGVKMSGDGNPVLLGLSYENGGKWKLNCGGGTTKELKSTSETERTHQVAIVLQNGNQSSAYVDGQPVGMENVHWEKQHRKTSHTSTLEGMETTRATQTTKTCP
ncbi:trans-sialidase, partial [Trypanosoma cruzi]